MAFLHPFLIVASSSLFVMPTSGVRSENLDELRVNSSYSAGSDICSAECSLKVIGDKNGQDAAKRLRSVCNVVAFSESQSHSKCINNFNSVFKKSRRMLCCECLEAQTDNLYSSSSPCAQYADKPKDVFVVAYRLFNVAGYNFFHSDLAFCPSSFDGDAPPQRIGQNAESNAEVIDYLHTHNCEEVVWDGRNDGDIWTPEKDDTGNWPPEEEKKAPAFGAGGLFYVGRTIISKAPWIDAMQSCHGLKGKKEWMDFNQGTYDMISHNCNSFVYQSLKYLNLPNSFASATSAKAVMGPLAAENRNLSPIKHKLAKKFAGGQKPEKWVSSQCREEAVNVGLLKEDPSIPTDD